MDKVFFSCQTAACPQQEVSLKTMQAEHRKIADFYNTTYYAREAAALTPPSRHLRGLLKKLPAQTNHSVLDIACGTGAWLEVLTDAGAKPHGIDISEKAVAVCQARLPGGDFRVGVAEQLPYPDNYFDLVSCLGSLEHFLDQPGALREMVRVAKARALFLLVVPNAGFPPYRLGLYRGTHQAAVRETLRHLEEWEAMF